jgi:hypothetical protein
MSRGTRIRQSALRVVPADGSGGIINVPHTLYFFVADGWTGAIPEDQEDARQELEQFSSTLRLTLKNDPANLREYFNQLLAVAQGTFSADDFRPESLSTMKTLKDELVHLAGPRLKHDYLKRLGKAVIVAFFAILIVAVVLDQVVKWGVSTGRVSATTTVGTPDASSGKDITAGQQPQKELESREFSVGNRIRWDGNFSMLHIGLLLSFSMLGLLFASMTRNLVPTFDNLLTPDADLMYPWIKLTYYGIAILIMGVLFEERWITVSLGERFSTTAINDNAIAAAIFGLFLGIAERLVPREVARYATEVVMRSGSRQSQDRATQRER